MIMCTLYAYIVQRNKLKREGTSKKCTANVMSMRECLLYRIRFVYRTFPKYILCARSHRTNTYSHISSMEFHLLSLSCFISSFFSSSSSSHFCDMFSLLLLLLLVLMPIDPYIYACMCVCVCFRINSGYQKY